MPIADVYFTVNTVTSAHANGVWVDEPHNLDGVISHDWRLNVVPAAQRCDCTRTTNLSCYAFCRPSACLCMQSAIFHSMSVCLSVRLSHTGIVSKWMHLVQLFHHGRGIILVVECYRHYKIPRATSSAGPLNTTRQTDRQTSSDSKDRAYA